MEAERGGQAISGDPGSHDGPGSHEGPGRGDSGEPSASDSLATEIALALVTAELGADAWPGQDGHDESTASRPAGRRLQLYPI